MKKSNKKRKNYKNKKTTKRRTYKNSRHGGMFGRILMKPEVINKSVNLGIDLVEENIKRSNYYDNLQKDLVNTTNTGIGLYNSFNKENENPNRFSPPNKPFFPKSLYKNSNSIKPQKLF
jgi:hypothetical protein